MAQHILDIESPASDIPVLEGWRHKGRAVLTQIGLPTAKTEAWRYTPLKIIQDNIFERAPQCSHKHHERCNCHADSELPFAAYAVHFHNGHLCRQHTHLPDGVELMCLEDAADAHETANYLNKNFAIADFPFAALNTAHLGQGVFLRVDRNVQLEQPIAFIYHTDLNVPILSNIRNIIIAESGAQFEWCEFYSGSDDTAYLNNVVNEVFLGRQAVIRHYKVQNEGRAATHIALNAVLLKAEARFESFCRQQGGALARTETYASLKESNAYVRVNAAYSLKGQAVSDITSNVNHLAANTHSDQLVKGVVDEEGKGVFQGQIHIAPKADKAQGYQLHKALLLSDEAEIDVKPALEIFADDVKCSHGAASGDLDQEQLFYLQARGIGKSEAEKILTKAFLDEAFEKVENTAVREWLQAF